MTPAARNGSTVIWKRNRPARKEEVQIAMALPIPGRRPAPPGLDVPAWLVQNIEAAVALATGSGDRSRGNPGAELARVAAH
ncbi:MAG: hypothetical protein DI527_12080 [Chelatococcus sp.]|nr:MAG: hypothetical protein DI527_12080 [Chelatococcus sp.]